MIFSSCFDYALLAYNAVVSRVASNPLRNVRLSYLSLPNQSVFPGPWEEYIRAPVTKSHIQPSKIRHVQGSVFLPDALLDLPDGDSSTTIGPGGLIILEFSENIAGR
ncbi:MAG: hypothetical protein Q9169_000624, partial [Polycauliona sp. 2 TL-2023]